MHIHSYNVTYSFISQGHKLILCSLLSSCIVIDNIQEVECLVCFSLANIPPPHTVQNIPNLAVSAVNQY